MKYQVYNIIYANSVTLILADTWPRFLSRYFCGTLFSTKGLVNQPLMSIKSLYFHYQYTYSGKLFNFMYIPRVLNTVDIHYLYKNKPII